MTRLRVYFEPRDAWVGAYIASDAVYVCLLPFVVLRWQRRVASAMPSAAARVSAPADDAASGRSQPATVDQGAADAAA